MPYAERQKCTHAGIRARDLYFFSEQPGCGSAAHFGHHALELAHFLHHLLHLGKAIEEIVEFGDGDTAAFGDSAAAAGVEDLRVAPFDWGHGADHGFHVPELLFALAHVCLLHRLGATGQHADDVLEGTKLFHLPQLNQEIIKRELAFAHFLLEPFGVFEVDCFSGAFDEADDIAHAEDARGHAFGMERFEIVELLADADELDRFSGDRFEAQGGPATGVAVEFGEDGAGNVEGLIELGGDVDGFLAGGSIENEENFLGFDQVTELDQFLDERFVDLEPAGGIEEEGVAVLSPGVLERFAGESEQVRFTAAQEDRKIELTPQRFELIHGGRAMEIGGDQERLASLFQEEACEFAGGGGLAGAVETNHEDAGRITAELDGGVGRPEEADHFILDDFDDLLAGLDALNDLLAQSLGLDLFDEIAGDLELDIRFQQRHADLTQGVTDVGLRDFAQAAQIAEGGLQFAAQRIEHGTQAKRRRRMRKEENANFQAGTRGVSAVDKVL
jgi:hypothetical protein